MLGLGTVWNFFKRHKRKFIVGGIFVGGKLMHRGSQLYFHITRYVLKRRREDTFWGAKSESTVSAPFFASKRV
jgi:hypothetical protein